MVLCFLANFLAASRRSSLYGGADFLYLIIVVPGLFFNPVFAEQAHKSCSALQSPDAPAGSAQQSPAPARPACRSVCCAPAPRPAPRGVIGRGSVLGMGKARPAGRALVGGAQLPLYQSFSRCSFVRSFSRC